MEDRGAFWEHPDQVEKFASREPDTRLVELLAEYPEPKMVRVLDLGCAGGRNTDLMAARRFDVHAVDASNAMVAKTRDRVARTMGWEMAKRRVRVASMDDLTLFPDGAFLLVVALGVLHNARARAEWERALAETARVLAPGGLLLSSNFSPQSDLTGKGLIPIDGEPGVYDGLPSGRHTLLEADEQDAEMARFGLVPRRPTRTVVVTLDVGRRVVVNALYTRR